MADGTSFTIDLPVTGTAGAISAADALDRLTAGLETAAAASVQAASAVAAGEASYRQAEAGADRAAKALERITLAADAQRGKLAAALDVGDTAGADRAAAKLANLVARQGEAAAKASEASAAVATEAAALDKLKASAAGAAEAHAKAGKELGAAKAATASAAQAAEDAAGSGKTNEIAEGLGKLGGPLGKTGQQLFGAAEGFSKLNKSMGSAGPYVAVAVAIAAIVAATVAASVAFASAVIHVEMWAVGLADAARSHELLTEGIAGSVAGGAVLRDQIEDISNETALSTERLTGMAKQLSASGLKGNDLAVALQNAAVKAAELEMGPDFAKGLTSISFQTEKLKKNISSIFSGLKIESLLTGLARLGALFDKDTVTANAMKVLFESLFQPLTDGLTDLIPAIEKAFINFEIWVLKAAIQVKPFVSKIILVGEAIGVVAALVTGVFAVAIGLIAAPFILATAAIVAIVAAILYLATNFDAIVAKIGGFLSSIPAAFVSGLLSIAESVAGFADDLIASFTSIGGNIIQGLIDGITGSAGGVAKALTGAVGGAVDGVKSLLGIASPSKVFAEIGMNTGAGMAQGVEGESARVQGSLESMVSPPDVGGAAPAAKAAPSDAGGKASGGGPNFSGATFNFNGVKGSEDVRDLLLSIIEGDLTVLGAAVAT